MTDQDRGGYPRDEQCTCAHPAEFRLIKLLIHGIEIRCETCGGYYGTIEDRDALEPLIDVLPRPDTDDVVLKLEADAWND